MNKTILAITLLATSFGASAQIASNSECEKMITDFDSYAKASAFAGEQGLKAETYKYNQKAIDVGMRYVAECDSPEYTIMMEDMKHRLTGSIALKSMMNLGFF